MTDAVIRDGLEQSIDELPDELRIVFVACVVDGITPEQSAELFALTSETVEARLHNARNLLGREPINSEWSADVRSGAHSLPLFCGYRAPTSKRRQFQTLLL